MNAPLIFFIARTQYFNLGDLVINNEILKELGKHGKFVIDDRGVPKWFIRELGLERAERASISGKGFKRRMLLNSLACKFTQKKSYFVLKPGHSFRDKAVNFREFAIFLYYLFVSVLGIKILRFGVSIGPFSSSMKLIERFKAKIFDEYTLRDCKSIEYAKKLKIKNAKYCPDIAYLLPYIHKKETTLALNNSDYQAVAMSFRVDSVVSVDNNYFEMICKHLNDVGSIHERFIKKLFVSQVSTDNKVMSELNKKFKLPGSELLLWDEKSSRNKIFDAYTKMDIVLSNRLHVLLFAMSRGCIPIPVIDKNVHSKITGIFSSEGLENLIFDVRGSNNLDTHLTDVWDDKDVYTKKMKTLFNNNRLIIKNTISSSF